jgi:hypothetical protein
VHAPVRELPLEGVRLDGSLRPRLLAFLLVLDLDEAALADALGQRRDEVGFSVPRARPGRLCELELSERFLQLAAHAVKRRVRVGGDHRADEFERQPDRARFQRCQARGMSERVTVELLVDMHLVALERRVDRVAASAEVDEVEELEVLLELVLGNVEALDDLPRGDDGVVALAACREQVREERLQDGEALRHHRARGTFAQAVLPRRRRRRS